MSNRREIGSATVTMTEVDGVLVAHAVGGDHPRGCWVASRSSGLGIVASIACFGEQMETCESRYGFSDRSEEEAIKQLLIQEHYGELDYLRSSGMTAIETSGWITHVYDRWENSFEWLESNGEDPLAAGYPRRLEDAR